MLSDFTLNCFINIERLKLKIKCLLLQRDNCLNIIKTWNAPTKLVVKLIKSVTLVVCLHFMLTIGVIALAIKHIVTLYD